MEDSVETHVGNSLLDGLFHIIANVNEDSNASSENPATINAKCMLCTHENKIVEGEPGMTSTFISHLERNHPKELENYYQRNNMSKVSESVPSQSMNPPADNTSLTDANSCNEERRYGDFFENLTNEEDSEEIIAQCILCMEKINIIESELGVTTYFITHLKKNHPQEFEICSKTQPNHLSEYNVAISDNLFDGFFEKLSSENKSPSKIIAKCHLCTDKNTIIQGAPGVTSNFITHFKRMHPKEYEDYINNGKNAPSRYSSDELNQLEKVSSSNGITKNKLFDAIFERMDCEKSVEKLIAKCLLCTHKETIIQGTANVTSNFIRHLKRIHPSHYKQYVNKKINSSMQRQTSTTSSSLEKTLPVMKVSRRKQLFTDFFEKQDCETPPGKVIAKCLLCTDKPTTVQGTINVTSNFIRHLKRNHPESYDEYLLGKSKHSFVNTNQDLSISEDKQMKDLKEERKFENFETADTLNESSSKDSTTTAAKDTTIKRKLFVDIFQIQISDADKVVAKCLLCTHDNILVEGSSRSSSKFMKHLIRKHPKDYAQYSIENVRRTTFPHAKRKSLSRAENRKLLFVDIFEKQSCDENKVVAKCLLCTHQNILIQGTLGVSSNFLTHFKRKHPIEYAKYTQNEDGPISNGIDDNLTSKSSSKRKLFDVFYEKQHYESIEDKLFARCLLCTHKRTVIQGYRNIKSNFNRHLKIKHAEEYENFLKNNVDESIKDDQNLSSEEDSSDECSEKSLSADFFINHSMDSEDITEDILKIEDKAALEDHLIKAKHTENKEFEVFVKQSVDSQNITEETLKIENEASLEDYLIEAKPFKYTEKKELLYGFFEKQDCQEFPEKLVAKCLVCTHKETILQGYPNVTSNFIRHLKRIHPREYGEYLMNKNKLAIAEDQINSSSEDISNDGFSEKSLSTDFFVRQEEDCKDILAIDTLNNESNDSLTYDSELSLSFEKSERKNPVFRRDLFDGFYEKMICESTPEKTIAKCLLCTHKNKIIRGYTNVTSNFISHLKCVHPKEYQEYLLNKSGKSQVNGTQNLSSFHVNYEDKDSDRGTTIFRRDLFNGFFEKMICESTPGKTFAKCLLCTHKNKIIRGYTNVTSNFISHLKSVHPKEYQEYLLNKSGKSQISGAQDLSSCEDIKSKIDDKNTITFLHDNFEDQVSKIGPAVFRRDLFNGFFEKMKCDSTPGKTFAKCLLCTHKNKIIRGHTNVTSNFISHLKSVHPKEYQEYLLNKSGKSQINGAQDLSSCKNIKSKIDDKNRITYLHDNFEDQDSNRGTIVLRRDLFNGFFEKMICESTPKKTIAKCLLCTDINKVIHGYTNVTSNFIGHLKRTHPEEYQEYLMNKSVKSHINRSQDISSWEDTKSTTDDGRTYLHENFEDQDPDRETAVFRRDLFDGFYEKMLCESTPEKTIAKCLLCTHKNKIIRGYTNVTSNFISHLKSVHPKEYQEYLLNKSGRSQKNDTQDLSSWEDTKSTTYDNSFDDQDSDSETSAVVTSKKKVFAKCLLCKTIIQAPPTVSSNLIRHLKRKHPGEYEDYLKNRASRKTLFVEFFEKLDSSHPVRQLKRNHSEINEHYIGNNAKRIFIEKKSAEQEEFNMDIAKFLTNTGLAVDTIENPYFKNLFINRNNFEIPSVNEINEVIGRIKTTF